MNLCLGQIKSLCVNCIFLEIKLDLQYTVLYMYRYRLSMNNSVWINQRLLLSTCKIVILKRTQSSLEFIKAIKILITSELSTYEKVNSYCIISWIDANIKTIIFFFYGKTTLACLLDLSQAIFIIIKIYQLHE